MYDNDHKHDELNEQNTWQFICVANNPPNEMNYILEINVGSSILTTKTKVEENHKLENLKSRKLVNMVKKKRVNITAHNHIV